MKSSYPNTARGLALRVLQQVVIEGQSLAQLLPAASQQLPERERGLLAELCYGTLRHYYSLQTILGRLVKQPVRRSEQVVELLLLLGLYQILYLRIPDYAAVTESVNLSRALGKNWAAGLVNAVLRNSARQREALEAQLQRPECAAALPDWLLQQLRRDWPQQWATIAAANNQHPPMTLRVNVQQGSVADYLALLEASGIAAQPHPQAPHALMLEHACDVQQLPQFAQGRVSVQDAAAQFAPSLLDLQPGQRVLDACAAPGGKTGHILETQPHLAQLVALDHDQSRLQRVQENLQRLGLRAQLCAGDAQHVDRWWDGQAFDRILLDAPCSATGVIRRHPDIKLLRQARDIPQLAATQLRLLQALWSTLRPGGVLLYATCSVLHAENEQLIRTFLAQQTDAHEWPITATWGLARTHGRQILTGEQGMDGFYYARLRKGAGVRDSMA